MIVIDLHSVKPRRLEFDHSLRSISLVCKPSRRLFWSRLGCLLGWGRYCRPRGRRRVYSWMIRRRRTGFNHRLSLGRHPQAVDGDLVPDWLAVLLHLESDLCLVLAQPLNQHGDLQSRGRPDLPLGHKVPQPADVRNQANKLLACLSCFAASRSSFI